MSQKAFPISYSVNLIRQQKYHHTDNSAGVEVNFFATMLSGRAEFVTENAVMHVHPGDIFFIPSGTHYHSYWYGEDEVSWLSVSLEAFPAPSGLFYPMQIIDAPPETCNILHSLAGKPRDCTMLGELYRMVGNLLPYMKPEQRSPERQLADRATAIMRGDLRMSIPEVARACSVSESGLYAAFRACGSTPVRVRQQLQIEYAVELLTATNMTVDAVAERAGFGSSAYFLRIFKKLTGKTTREIRRGTEI